MIKKFITLAVLAVACCLPSYAQTFSARTDTFVFDKTSAITSWNGSAPYPYHMGAVILTGPNGPGIIIPFELGYLNNGYLVPCDPIAWSAKTWVIGTGANNGDTYVVSGSTTCPYFTGEYGTSGNSADVLDGFSVTA